ncbi:MAG TPA: phage baseplate assembly protein V [Bryobacteraceae bacterium]|nr:phage baseplate assembly protein V [Bryobacteraceae bacterium]
MLAGHVQVNIDGKIIYEWAEKVLLDQVSVVQELNQHSWCYIHCRQTEDQRLPIEEALGKDLVVSTHEEDTGLETVVFDGIIWDVEQTYQVFGTYIARLTGVTRSYKMDLTPRKAYYLGKPLSAIASELAGHAGLNALCQHPDKRPLNHVQWGESDFSFLNRLVDDHGCWMRPTADGIEISDEFRDTVELKWRDEFGLIEFTTKGTLGQPSFNGSHYNHHEMKSEVFEKVKDEPAFFGSISPLVNAVKTQSQDLPPGYVYQRSRVVTLDEYQDLLKKESVRSIGGNIRAFGKSARPKLRPGDKASISGVLDAEGVYGITAVKHQWTAEGYTNDFQCTPWTKYTNPEPPEMKPWFGAVPARVVEHNDPKKMGRVRVQYFWQQDGPAYWARMMTPHAGSDRGFMFMPEVGDEVAVIFEDGDPERPLVLGCLWNGVDQAPRKDFRGDDVAPNDVKRIITKSGCRLQFSDKKDQESIVLATPHTIRIQLIEGATAPNSQGAMLVLESSGDIFFSAPNGRIHFKSKYFSREVGDPSQPSDNYYPI